MTITHIAQTLKLSNGRQMPWFGLGVWSAPTGKETQLAVKSALEVGYRHIDTAEAYRNETDVGIGIKESGIPRSEIFITTKLARANGGYDKALTSFESSIEKLAVDYIDLYLVHWPTPETRRETWRALETIYASGRAHAIGVSNYTLRHLKELETYAKILPMCNQVEMSPFLYQKELVEYCHQQKIAVSAYSPLTRGVKLDHPTVLNIASKRNRTPGQVMIRWCLDHGLLVFPKSTHQARIIENAGVFDWSLTGEDLTELDQLNENFRCNADWNPENEK